MSEIAETATNEAVTAKTEPLDNGVSEPVEQDDDKNVAGLYYPHLVPTSIVLAKVKGFPPWPAMVLEETLLPPNIIGMKPRTVKQPKKPKRAAKAGPTVAAPVRFFSDDTYIWIKNTDLKPLGTDEINKYLEKFKNNELKKRKDNLLHHAYELAANPPDMELFVTWGSKGEPAPAPVKVDEGPEYEPGELEEVEEEEEEEEEEEDEEEEEEYGNKRKRQKRAPAKKAAPKAKSATKKTVVKKEKSKPAYDPDPYDSDWGLDGPEYSYDEGNYIFDDEKEQVKFHKLFPTAAAVGDRLAKAQGQMKKLEKELAGPLLDIGDETSASQQDEVFKGLQRLGKVLKTFPKALVAKSALYKVLLLVVHRPNETFPSAKIRKEVARILQDTNDLVAVEITVEDLEEPKEPEPEPQAEAEAVPNGQEPVEGAEATVTNGSGTDPVLVTT